MSGLDLVPRRMRSWPVLRRWYWQQADVDRFMERARRRAAALRLTAAETRGWEHDDWCDASGCRCGKCPCLGPPSCRPARPVPSVDDTDKETP